MYKMHNHLLPEVLVVTVTHRGKEYLQNIANNFLRQKYPTKRLMVILNTPDLEEKEVEEYMRLVGVPFVNVYRKLDTSMGLCLQESVNKMSAISKIWAKMDDDDFYDQDYLLDKVLIMLKNQAHVVGQIHMISYVPEIGQYFLRKDGPVTGYSTWVRGASLVVLPEVFQKVQFRDIQRGSDTQFLKDVVAHHFRIFAGPPQHFMNIRHVDVKFHTWKEEFVQFLRKTTRLSLRQVQGMFPQLELLKEHFMGIHEKNQEVKN
jgi:hypothetical protein